MYINFKILKKRELELEDFLLLQAAKQSKFEDLSVTIDIFSKERVDKLLDKGFLSKIKGLAKDPDSKKIRTTKKGNDLLDDLETPEIEEEDIVMFDWICDVYITMGKEIGNKKKTKTYIALFRTHSGIEKNHLATLLEKFVKDDFNMAYNFRLEYAFFKPSNVYQSRFELDQSRLYQYYLNNKLYFDKLFEQTELENA